MKRIIGLLLLILLVAGCQRIEYYEVVYTCPGMSLAVMNEQVSEFHSNSLFKISRTVAEEGKLSLYIESLRPEKRIREWLSKAEPELLEDMELKSITYLPNGLPAKPKPKMEPSCEIHLDREKISKHGLAISDISERIKHALDSGVRKDDAESISKLALKTSGGKTICVGDIAKVKVVMQPSVIVRETVKEW